MQIFKNQEHNQEEELLKTAIELYERDKKQSQNQRTVEQVLNELEIPLEYLDRAKAEITQRQLPKDKRFTKPGRHNRRIVAAVMVAVLFAVFLTGAIQLVQRAAPSVNAPMAAPKQVSALSMRPAQGSVEVGATTSPAIAGAPKENASFTITQVQSK